MSHLFSINSINLQEKKLLWQNCTEGKEKWMNTGWEIQEITKNIMINGKQKHGSHTYLKIKVST